MFSSVPFPPTANPHHYPEYKRTWQAPETGEWELSLLRTSYDRLNAETGWLDAHLITTSLVLLAAYVTRLSDKFTVCADPTVHYRLLTKKWDQMQVLNYYRPLLGDYWRSTTWIIPFHINGNHWVLCKLDIPSRTVDFFDSFGHWGTEEKKRIHCAIGIYNALAGVVIGEPEAIYVCPKDWKVRRLHVRRCVPQTGVGLTWLH